MAAPVNFRYLVDQARAHGLDATDRPREMLWVAVKCRVSLSQIYNLINGTQCASDSTTARIAAGLRIPKRRVVAALSRSRADSGIWA